LQILLSFFYLFYFAIIGVYVIFLPKVLSTIGYSANEIGIILAVGPLIKFLIPFAFTKFLSLNLHIFRIALYSIPLSSIALYLSINNFYLLLFTNILLGAGLSLILPYIEVIALEELKKERYGKIRLFGSLGFILVALVLVKFLSSNDIALYYLIFLTYLTSFFGILIALSTKKLSKQENTKIKNDISLGRDWRLWLSLILMQVSFGSFYNFFTIYETSYHISLQMTIYMWSFGVIIEILMLFFQARFLQYNLLNILQITIAITAFRWLLLFLYPEMISIVFFSQSLHAFSFALFHSATITYLYQLYNHKALAQQFFSGLTYGLGGFIGAIFAGYIYQYFPAYIFLSSSLIAIGAYIFITLYKSKTYK